MFIELTTSPIHFEDKSGAEFERLVFAYAVREKDWDSIEWLGQTGKDGGRDIWGELNGETFCYACANYRDLTYKKVKEDIDKLVKHKTIPNVLIVVCGGKISVRVREHIKDYCTISGIAKTTVWSGVEFEEKLRKYSPELVRRFVMGEQFPDSPRDLIQFAKAADAVNDNDIINLLAECFDRPAFTTPFHLESNIPDFERALTNTIEVLNTGVHRLNDGTTIRTIPSRHRISDGKLKSELASITQSVIELRTSFMNLKRNGEIKQCSCGEAGCPIYILTPAAYKLMDETRNEIFTKFKKIKPDFNLLLY